jgi:phenylalanyl-tRNA synthetase alpha chain
MDSISELDAELVVDEWTTKIDACASQQDLEDIRLATLGKNGIITLRLKYLNNYSSAKKREYGSELNQIKCLLENLISAKKKQLVENTISDEIKNDTVDISLPERPQPKGSQHLLTQLSDELVSYFAAQGFIVMRGPEIDSEFNNFEALNIQAHHPARQEQDTLYIKDVAGTLLRTHTSTMQIRTFSTIGVPVRAISIGSVFRNDSVDATHSPIFHQIEIFVVEPGITIAHMKYCLLDLLSFLFETDLYAMYVKGQSIPVRFRPSFFPFTEPSMEVDCRCSRIGNELKLDINGEWMEILGCGMIHPNVFSNCGIHAFPDGSCAQGFAIGIGIERIAMLKYGITDIRHFYDGNIQWLQHYRRAQ